MAEQVTISQSPTPEQRRRILNFIMAVGTTLLANGAEVFRVEQTMQHIAAGYQLGQFDVYVLSNGIFASAGGAEFSEVRHVPDRSVHLGRVAALNALSRQISAGDLPIEAAEDILQDVQNMPVPSVAQRVIASAFGSFGFCFLFGGGFVDALVALLAGALLGGYLCHCERHGASALFERLSGAALVAAVCILAEVCLPVFHIQPSAAIIGAVMILTPGVAFTMAIRDFVHSDYLSGAIRMLDALLVAASIAIGAGLVLWVEAFLRGGGL